MTLARIESLFNRIFFLGALLLFAVAVLEKLANLNGYTIIAGAYAPGRLFEFAAIMLLFVITLLLRDIRGPSRS